MPSDVDPSFAGQPPPSRLVSPPIGDKSTGPALPPQANVTKNAPPKNSIPMKHVTRVRLNPTTRVASVPVSPVPPLAGMPPGSGFRDSFVPRAATTAPTSAPQTHSDDHQVVEAMQAAYQKTEVHLKAIEAKLNLLHKEIQRTASPATSRELPTEALGNNSTAESVLGSLVPIATTGAPGSKAAANHHLQPIPSAMATPLPPVPLTSASTSTVVAKPKTSAATSAVVESSATAAAATPATAKANRQHSPLDLHFVDHADILDSPNASIGSDSSSNDSSDSSSDAGHTLPNAARHSAGKPAFSPAQTPAAATDHSEPSNRTAAQVRQRVDLKDVSHANACSSAVAASDRRAMRFREGGERSRTAHSFPASLSSATPPADRGSTWGTGERGEVVAVGREFRQFSSQASTLTDAKVCFSLGESGNHAVDNAQAVDRLGGVSRRQANVVKHVRERFFAPIPRFDDVLPRNKAGLFNKRDIEKLLLPGAPCSWLCCASLAISYVSRVPTPVEKVLRANRMGVHYISLPTITLAELFDVVSDYIHVCYHRTAVHKSSCTEDEFEDDAEASRCLSEDELRQLAHIHCEMATFDKEVLDPEFGEDMQGMGEHPPIMNPTQLRKELLLHLGEEKSMYIFYYNPYVLEQAQLRLRSNQCDTEEEAAAVMATARFSANVAGLFGILLDFNSVSHEVKLLTPYLSAEEHPLHFKDDEGEEGVHARHDVRRFASTFSNLVVEEQLVSLHALYESVQQSDKYLGLSRGYVRVFMSESFPPKVPSMFPLFVLDGSSAGGLVTSVLNVKIAPHVLGLAMLHHLSVTFLLTESARRKQSSRNLLGKTSVCDVKLRGIPLTKVCQQLRLPLSMIVCESNKGSIEMAYGWYHVFLQQLQIDQDVCIGLVLPSRRDGAADGQPNITDDRFVHHLQLMIESKSVMLISFDMNIALNVRIDSRSDPAHFAIVIGVDEERGVVRLADVNVKRFRKTWHIPISRLYNAVMGYGYIVASRSRRIIKALEGKHFHENALQCARNFLPPPTPAAYHRFEYPPCPYPLTVLADAVERLGFAGTNVEHFLNFCGFHISYFLSPNMPLEGAAFVIQNYSHYALDDAVSVATTHYDFYEGNLPPKEEAAEAGGTPTYPVRSEADLLESIQYAIAEPDKRKLIVRYDVNVLQADETVWNGNHGNSFAFVVDYVASKKMVVLSDASPSSFYRSFACPLAVLFNAMCSWDSVSLRAHGTILLTTEVTQESMHEDTKGYDMAHALVHHPFKPMFSAVCSCLALASTEMMMNIENPRLLSDAPISVEDEHRKYRRENNIFSTEDFLYALPSFSVCRWRTQAVDIQDVGSVANRAFATLKLPLRIVDVLQEQGPDSRTDPKALLRACNGISGLQTITLVTYDAGVLHGAPGLSAGLLNRVRLFDDENKEATVQPTVPGAPRRSVGSVQLLEGDPCRWGACFERSAEELMRAIKGIYRVEEAMHEDADG
ncbi:conserved hypothetical protein [Leishmania mexicana MHOM/GT/2001/U1103]|uniref:Uncharacterized protein n=1 Tax=Leishmania mexicana (strain MHOM/GT/2001/U1103) TaxID=929439 RepID=E9ARR6_LEIMU|nr:conserved hypothetical protein [Leishmania mexicana MHOM/GT/2001/U1103]CBZ25637.1 conserved hypothetical protein [Leishmania mexicana MHOM/GT/2001/U1103]